MAQINEFDQSMWDGFAGCEAFDDGEPLWRELDGGLLIADRNGIGYYKEQVAESPEEQAEIDEFGPSTAVWLWNIDLPLQKFGRALLSQIETAEEFRRLETVNQVAG